MTLFGLDARIFALRCIMFFATTGASSIARYMILFLQPHFSTSQLGIIMGVTPAIRFIASFCWGFIGDYTQSRMIVASCGMIIGIIGYNGLLFPLITNSFVYTICLMSVCQFFGSAGCLLDAVTCIILSEQQTLNKLIANSNIKASISIKEITVNPLHINENNNTKDKDNYHCLPTSQSDQHSINQSNNNKKKEETGTAKYGSTRLWGAVGWGLGSVICGTLLYEFGEYALFWFYDGNMLIVSIILVCFFPIAIRKESKYKTDTLKMLQTNPIAKSPTNHFNDIDDVFELPIIDINNNTEKHSYCKEFTANINNMHSFLFFANLFVCGIGTALVENFLFLFLTEYFGASDLLCGLTLVCMVSGEVPVFHFSKYLIEKVGLIGLMGISHFAYFVRVLGYSFLPQNATDVWFILFIEPLHGLTFAGMWIASIEYGSRITPNHLKGTMLGLMSGMYGGGISGSIGCIVGGVIYQYYGPVLMYRYAGFAMIGWMFVFQISFRLLKLCKPNSYAVNTLFGYK
eukprot:284416_1